MVEQSTSLECLADKFVASFCPWVYGCVQVPLQAQSGTLSGLSPERVSHRIWEPAAEHLSKRGECILSKDTRTDLGETPHDITDH